ncbi:Flp pilus assembly protein CpaB [Roseospira goensis]|uniref:Pilus assembly protein CpaB n=1 Tax=Roseospira goensis TaxID=391922 RepID=A0A7W6S1F2_9PROT|nr:Flp pilus assembly protein CpaB [Roseospira goensis]MBB4287089.1 pilus assembly protein CpaB [Roseospira goensis]
MRAVLLLVIAIAVAAAGGAAYLVNSYLAQQRQQTTEEEPVLPVFTGQRVLVADEDIEAGVPLRGSMFRWQPWPEEDILSVYKVIGETEGLTERQIFNQRTRFEEEMSGKITRRFIAAGEPITDRTVFDRANASFMAGALEPGMRAISIPVNEASGAAGFILPGDRVDIVLTHDLQAAMPRGASGPGVNAPVARYVSETILESLRVLAVDQEIRGEDDEAQLVDTVTVEVSAAEAEIVNLARQMGSLTLTLRALSDRQGPVGLASLLGLGGPARERERQLVTDRSVSGGLDMLLRAAAEAERQRELRELAREQAQEPEPVMAPPVVEPPPPEPVEEGPAWTVTVYRGGAGEPTVYEGLDQGVTVSAGESGTVSPSGAAPVGRSGPPGAPASPDDVGPPIGITPEMMDEIPIEE